MDLTFRADASGAIGAGHVMRCLTLAEGWLQKGGTARGWGRIDIPFVRERAEQMGIAITDRGPASTDVLLVDVYDELERATLGRFGASRLRVIVDDMGATIPDGYGAVWNPNAYGSAAMYEGFGGETLAGLSCVPIRPGLPRWEGGSSGAVSFGGGSKSPRLKAILDAFEASLRPTRLLGVGADLPPGWVGVPPTNPWHELKSAGWMVTTASSTLWEAAAVGIPVVVTTFVNNHALAAEWASACDVPVVDLMTALSAEETGARLAQATERAAVLPRIGSGVDHVVSRIASMAA